MSSSHSAPGPIRIGVDIGGTFTDLQILDGRTGRLTSFKTPTTPDDPSRGLMAGVTGAAARDGFALADVGYVLHGTTIATNAVLERRLARGALVTTARFEDVIEIGRHVRKDIYSLNPVPPPALIPRDRRLGVVERIRADGTVETPLAADAVADLLARLKAAEPEAVALCLMNAYRNPAHEIALAEAIAAALPGLPVCRSSALSPEIREYERASTTVLNALLMPVVAGYVAKLRARMAAEGFAPRLLIIQSNGGVCSPQTAAEEPARLLLSGPAGGAAACAQIAARLGLPDLVGADMGGTSFDVCVVREGAVSVVTQGEIDHLPVRLPMAEIRTIGAGGGSIAQVRPGGRVTVGPESAGARPGPAAYGHGGTEPTVTDANVVLGKLDPDAFLGGKMRLDVAAAREAMTEKVAAKLGLSAEAAAEGLLAVTDAALGAAIRLSLFEKGLDPRDFAMLAFGGAAGMHATRVAEELGVVRVVFPKDASTLSAYGILHSAIAHDLVRAQVTPVDGAALAALLPLANGLDQEAAARLDADAVASEHRRVARFADMRYRGQAFELTIPAQVGPFDQRLLDGLLADFHATHLKRFGYSDDGAPVEIVALRAKALGDLPLPATQATATAATGSPSGRRRVYLDGGWRDTPVYPRAAIGADVAVAGPLVIEEPYTTVVIGPGWSVQAGADGHLIADRTGAAT